MESFADVLGDGVSWDSLKVILPLLLTLALGGVGWGFRLERLISRLIVQEENHLDFRNHTTQQARDLWDSTAKLRDKIQEMDPRIAKLEVRVEHLENGNPPRQRPRS